MNDCVLCLVRSYKYHLSERNLTHRKKVGSCLPVQGSIYSNPRQTTRSFLSSPDTSRASSLLNLAWLKLLLPNQPCKSSSQLLSEWAIILVPNCCQNWVNALNPCAENSFACDYFSWTMLFHPPTINNVNVPKPIVCFQEWFVNILYISFFKYECNHLSSS